MAHTLTKKELAYTCNVSLKKVARWCNRDFYNELKAMGYYKRQKEFTPKQAEFLKQNIIEFSDT